MKNTISLFSKYGTRHYERFPVVFVRGHRIYLWDSENNMYIDAMAGYSALNHGHCNPRILSALTKQANMLGIVSNSYYTEPPTELSKQICLVSGQDKALIMNTGAEAVETGIKIARKWGYTVKGVPHNKAKIIVCKGNFHGRTTTIVGFSSERQFHEHFGPYSSGFRSIPFGNTKALERAITPNTVAFLVEPIQGEGGIRIPPPGYLKRCAEICKENNVLLIADEIQTGLGRTGKMFACDHEDVKPDMMLLGKSLGGGSGIAISVVVGREEVMGVLEPGDHGSTFGGTPLACAVALESLAIIHEEKFAERSAVLGAYFLGQLEALKSPYIREVRGKGLFIGIEVDLKKISAKKMCEKLLENRVVSKDAHGVLRLTPPLVIEIEEIYELVKRIAKALDAK